MPISMSKITAAKDKAPSPAVAAAAAAAAQVGEAKPKGQTLKLTKPAAANKKPPKADPVPETVQEAAEAAQDDTAQEAAPETVETAQTPSQVVQGHIETDVKNNATGQMTSESQSEAVEIPTPAVVRGHPVVVGYSLSYTHNLGNYCSAKGTVSISIPCAPEDVDATADSAKDWCDTRLTALAAELQAMGE